jgi:hypothetical protein
MEGRVVRLWNILTGITVAAAVLLAGPVAEAKRIKGDRIKGDPPGWVNVRAKNVGWARRGFDMPPGQTPKSP